MLEAADRILVLVSSEAGWTLRDIEPLPPARVVRTAIRCLEQAGERLEMQYFLSISPMEAAFSQEHPAADRILGTAARWRGYDHHQPRTLRDYFDDEEWEAIQEIEREIAEKNPWTADPERLAAVWAQAGTMQFEKKDGLDFLRQAGAL